MMPKSRILASSCKISLSCSVENSRPMAEVRSNDSYSSKLPEYLRGPESLLEEIDLLGYLSSWGMGYASAEGGAMFGSVRAEG